MEAVPVETVVTELLGELAALDIGPETDECMLAFFIGASPIVLEDIELPGLDELDEDLDVDIVADKVGVGASSAT